MRISALDLVLAVIIILLIFFYLDFSRDKEIKTDNNLTKKENNKQNKGISYTLL